MDSQRRTVSRISQSNEPVRASSSNHEGLMSWPENFFTARNSFVNETTQTSLSARAMELSIYGSMMNDMRGQFGSFRRSSQGPKNHSLSYPRVPTGTAANVRPLVSVQSEGNSMNTRLGTREPFRVAPTPPLPRRRRQRNVEGDDSSDDSGGEVIVRIDSPSTLSFSNLS
ncbi:Sodium/hydrogen exchanger 7 [Dendrobium catenatum]|uniref:Sodium/hydrogen exchanger 7 n=2 Tax=Dendrobium catenatum TaxID=906689 RepID=A0A2I0XI36_9ASPA|nr:Sodium/hydrogen exchanger 7 [Dendrobium catenatum]